MNRQKIIFLAVILIILATNAFFAFEFAKMQKELNQTKVALENSQKNEQILNFNRLFIKKILKSDKEVDFETRLELENAVRNLKDDEILNQWKKFTEAEDENEAQREVKNLLWLLVNKINTSNL